MPPKPYDKMRPQAHNALQCHTRDTHRPPFDRAGMAPLNVPKNWQNRPRQEWDDWPWLQVKVTNLPIRVSTWDLYQYFTRAGNISRIKIINADSAGYLPTAFVTFDPPPLNSLSSDELGLLGGNVPHVRKKPQIQSLPPQRNFLYYSPADKEKKRAFPERIALVADELKFGFFYEPNSITVLRKCQFFRAKDNHYPIKFTLELPRQEIEISFSMELDMYSEADGKWVPDILHFKIKMKLAQISRVYEHRTGTQRTWTITLNTAPKYFRKYRVVQDTHDDSGYWDEAKIWPRQTELVQNRETLKGRPLTLIQEDPVIDLGRWTTYVLQYDTSTENSVAGKLDWLLRAFKDHNVEVIPGHQLKRVSNQPPPLDRWLDLSFEETKKPSQDLLSKDQPIDFKVRYQLEVCLSHGILHEINIKRDFLSYLANLDVNIATNILEQIANMKERIFKPMEIFNVPLTSQGTFHKTIPSYCVRMRSATVTPTTVHYNSPTIEISNRIIRQFMEHADRFLRVRFTEEKGEGRISPQDDDTSNMVWSRFHNVMKHGITVGGRSYKFLAFGNSQFREHGAYFFAPLPDNSVNPDTIRRRMGNFDDIKIIAKYCSRMGQCFSTTRAVDFLSFNIEHSKDVERNGFCFTDGIGKISRWLASRIADTHGVPNAYEDPPSAFQIRLGGCKGMLAVSPDLKPNSISIRPSQDKFPCEHNGLEIIRISDFATATLNRQLITILSTLGVRDEIFMAKMTNTQAELNTAMTNEVAALGILQKYIDANQTSLTIAAMILDGFMKAKEPFMMSLLQLWRAWSLKYLKEKAKILIDKGAFVLGVIDETCTLKGHSNTQQCNPEATREQLLNTLPEIFIQVSDVTKKGSYKVIKGVCLLARNPSLHPGDIRVVRAIDVKGLHHLKNVVALPQTGDRDLANMCSGGDLDGDDYIVMWDEDLIPAEINHPPMDHAGLEPDVEEVITMDDITRFLVQYMKNDRLGKIAYAHMAWSDYSLHGVKDEKCLELAVLHSHAVDYPKSGQVAKMTHEHRPRKWPHFMEKDHLPEHKRYHSDKILGQLYDSVSARSFDFMPNHNLPFDKRILDACPVDEDMVRSATKMKEQYDTEIRQIMNRYGISTETEVWSAFVLRHNGEKNDYSFTEEIGKLVMNLRAGYRKKVDSKQAMPFAHAMYVATARQVSGAAAKGVEAGDMPLMSFPWLFGPELGKIANKIK